MKTRLLLVPLAALLAIAAAGTGGASPQAPEAAANATIRCGNVRTIGFLAPKTGLAASLGQTQVRWVRYFVTRWNATHRRGKLRLREGDTKLGGPVSEA